MISYQPGRETVTIRQTITGTDVPGHLKLETTLDGTIPQIPDNARVEADDYKDEYRRIAPGEKTALTGVTVGITASFN